MHLLATTSGVIDGGSEAVDLAQSPADIVVLSAADSELASLARAHDGAHCPLRLANLLQLQHPLSVDLYIEKTLAHAKLIVLRVLGGTSYWSYGLDQVEAMARERGIMLCILPGDAQPDPDLTARSTLAPHHCERLRQYLVTGGAENAAAFLAYCRHLTEGGDAPPPARELPKAGLYRDASGAGRPCAAIVFYRSVLEGAQTAPIDALVDALFERGVGAKAFYVASLKDRASVEMLQQQLAAPDVILNCTSFAVASGGSADPLAAHDCPVLQVVLSGSSEESWRESAQGLNARDLAMNVVLPELDGRIMSRAVSFKADSLWHEATECRIVTYRAVPDRVAFVADLAANWAKLRRTPAPERRVAIVLANYPNKDGRIANGVGYDTPASTVAILDALRAEGYGVGEYPETGNDIIEDLQRGPTNAARAASPASTHSSCLGSSRASFADGGEKDRRVKPGDDGCVLAMDNYLAHFNTLPEPLRTRITARWGDPSRDPFFADGAFHLPIRLYGNAAVAIQPARGYNIDPKSTYHDPALLPPHGYLAFYFWLRHHFKADAVIHNGKHGNLEWLPGKANALTRECLPEVALGALPQLYPFIVNDPGEGTQAKRRTGAVIIDHLTPPLTRAETYGPLKDLEALVDEYYLASGLDARRRDSLKRDILDLTKSSRLDADAGFTGEDDADLQRLDAFLCDLKEAQIRDGLHILGTSPQGRLETDLLLALTRVPRGLGEGGDQSLIRALAKDFGFTDFDPLTCEMAAAWAGDRPAQLQALTTDPWRSNGDAVERLELFAASLLDGAVLPNDFAATHTVLAEIDSRIRPALRACGPDEIASLLKGLAGQFVAPGSSGAPTRGRLDVLPTGRNFYSLDNRTVPTATAWNLGQKSAEDLLLRHFQDVGQYPKALGLSAWGTSNMRTGGDDIAQALALIGARPVWEPSSWRVTGYEIIPLAKLGRPRVDVTLRISGFFRDAFPAQIELLDRAIRAVGALDEDDDDNPLAARIRTEAKTLAASGIDPEAARDMAGHRIFGSRPGAYGAGLQALIDEKIWTDRTDLAAAYITWGAYAYGAKAQGINDEKAFTERLKRIEAVVHNQDNREHDLLDSDDYYQFEGGMTAAVEQASGSRPRVYHNDHSRPERPVIRTLEEEVGRVMRSRVVNPKWIAGVKRHGYKGAFEIAATVDYMFAFAATTGAVRTHHFDLAYDAFLADDATRDFIRDNNPAALREIAERFAEARERGLWTPRLNSTHDLLEELTR
ncbi:cobaltochelatase subunit CobN [Aestuariivirga litoralis]|uniref:Cobaltochelatase subunit CobN n=1 Tax=Aestuariivirga litoralis TaxID=2650924 RepID=A0A2W2C9J9_9HYPH|nr:cobaltochelatase subunit CobN [Aestuariivirga litoralis]PZF76843.1 cobaltochelatase subunit CobN [Aestuariivirga litoralis]